MTSHTPGEWLIGDGAFVYALNAEGSNRFCAQMQGGWQTQGRLRTDREELEANARLIAAAPELLEACKRWEAMIPLLRMLTVHQVLSAGDAAIGAAGLNPYCINEGLAAGDEPAIAGWKFESIRAAIAKATGATP
jgi:hypothetical protein